MLEMLGLDKQAHDVYRELLLSPDRDLRGLAEKVGISDDDVRHALDRLSDLSLLHYNDGEGTYIPANPEIGIAPRLDRLAAELDEQQARLSRDRAGPRFVLAFRG